MNPSGIDSTAFEAAVLELVRRASCQLPADVVEALVQANTVEEPGSPAAGILSQILENIELAAHQGTPVCQDTGTYIFYVKIPVGMSMQSIRKMIENAVAEATAQAILRPNAVDSITGRNSGNNLGIMAPYINFDESDSDSIEISLLLKGGGSENVSTQYKLPNSDLAANRDLDGVYKCVVDAVNQAQGMGCSPGIIGVGIGGDRATGMATAKKQLFRKLNTPNSDQVLNELEERLVRDLNTLGIGPMGVGGKTTVLGVKIGAAHRLPASFFVSIAYMCWANRRARMTFSGTEASYD